MRQKQCQIKFRRHLLTYKNSRLFNFCTCLTFLSLSAGAVNAQSSGVVENPVNPTLSKQDSQAKDFVRMGLRFEHAEGEQKDFSKAHEAYCNGAKLNSTEAYVRLGWMYANGRGIPRNDSIANSLFRRAALLGDEMATRLADMIRGEVDLLPNCLSAPSQPPLPQTNLRSVAALRPLPTINNPRTFSQFPNNDKTELLTTVNKVAKDFKLDPRLAVAVMRAESNYDPLARSSKGAQGLMQLIPETAERFAVTDINDSSQNIRGGMAYLKWLLSLYRGDVVLSLAAYNSGENTVKRFNGVPPYAETMAYVQRIRAYYPLDFHAFDERAASFREKNQASKSYR
jgi:hypothetical protein